MGVLLSEPVLICIQSVYTEPHIATNSALRKTEHVVPANPSSLTRLAATSVLAGIIWDSPVSAGRLGRTDNRPVGRAPRGRPAISGLMKKQFPRNGDTVMVE